MAGIALGAVLPGVFYVLSNMKVAEVNIPVAVLIVSSRPGTALIHEGYGFRAGQVAGVHASQLETSFTDHAVYPPVQIAASGDMLPRRSERVPPSEDASIGCTTMLHEQQCAAGPQNAAGFPEGIDGLADAA